MNTKIFGFRIYIMYQREGERRVRVYRKERERGRERAHIHSSREVMVLLRRERKGV